MRLQKVEKLDKNFISSVKICKRPFTSAIRLHYITQHYIQIWHHAKRSAYQYSYVQYAYKLVVLLSVSIVLLIVSKVLLAYLSGF